MPQTTERNRLSSSASDFIAEAAIEDRLLVRPEPSEVRDIIAKSMAKEPLSIDETARLVAADDRETVEEIFDAARQLKKDIYGNRIVLFAPLYVGNECTNDCRYCAFRRSNKKAVRRTLDPDEISEQVEAMLDAGHKRLILVFGETPQYNARFIADCVSRVYSVKSRGSSIRRVNINAAPMDHAGYRTVKEAAIGTYQIFQETYHRPTYRHVHLENTRKGDYLWRLDGVARAMEAGLDDVGIGALFGLYDWRYELLGLIAHAVHLAKHYGVGPHTISFPRLRPASGVTIEQSHLVDDYDFKRLVAILRLAVPYTGLILTAREPPELRREVLAFGVSQIDAGTRIELGGYTETADSQVIEREQFELGDLRTLDEVIGQLIVDGYVPSFCTACYRIGRTGEHFMEYAIPGFIQKMCTPNALSTLMEYLVDYGSQENWIAGQKLIEHELGKLPDGERKSQLLDRLRRIKETDERDLYF